MAERTYREDALAGRLPWSLGAGGGIGRVTALAFARVGARVVVSDMTATVVKRRPGFCRPLDTRRASFPPMSPATRMSPRDRRHHRSLWPARLRSQ